MWVTSRTGSVGWDLRKVSESSFSVGRRKLTFACSPRPCGRCRTWFEADGKVSIEIWYLSLYVEKPFNSKVIKSFVPELRSRKCFSCFRIPMLSVCALWTLWTFCVPVWICLFHIFMYGYVTSICISKSNLLILTFSIMSFFLLFNFFYILVLFFTEKTSILVSFSSTLSTFFSLNLHTAWKWFISKQFVQVFPNAVDPSVFISCSRLIFKYFKNLF